MGNKTIPFLLFLLPIFTGCARSGDGTVMIPHMMDARRIWDKGPTGTQTPLVHSPTVFPVAPVSEHPRYRPSASTVKHRKIHVRKHGAAAPPAMEPTKPIACGAAHDLGDRVRMTCQ
jgi:hypothetical protein